MLYVYTNTVITKYFCHFVNFVMLSAVTASVILPMSSGRIPLNLMPEIVQFRWFWTIFVRLIYDFDDFLIFFRFRENSIFDDFGNF